MTSLSPHLLAGLVLFAFVSSITPGPNNTMLLASGANFGLRRTIPHLLGVSIGFFVLMACLGLGLGGLFLAYPVLHEALKIVGGLYLLYLAGKIAMSAGLGGVSGSARPQTFAQAAAFQWVNPKAWAMALGGIATYAPSTPYVAGVLLVSGVFTAVNLPCVGIWATFGLGLRRFLDRPKVLRTFNLVMAALLVVSLYPIVQDWLGR